MAVVKLQKNCMPADCICSHIVMKNSRQASEHYLQKIFLHAPNSPTSWNSLLLVDLSRRMVDPVTVSISLSKVTLPDFKERITQANAYVVHRFVTTNATWELVFTTSKHDIFFCFDIHPRPDYRDATGVSCDECKLVVYERDNEIASYKIVHRRCLQCYGQEHSRRLCGLSKVTAASNTFCFTLKLHGALCSDLPQISRNIDCRYRNGAAETNMTCNALLTTLRHDQSTADIRFRVEDKTFHAHRAILSAQSPYFKSMLFTSGMKESCDGDSIELSNVSADIFKLALDHCYFVFSSCDRVTNDHVWQLLAMADFYQLDRLKSECLLTLYGTRHPANVMELIMTVSQYKDVLCQEFRDVLLRFICTHLHVDNNTKTFVENSGRVLDEKAPF